MKTVQTTLEEKVNFYDFICDDENTIELSRLSDALNITREELDEQIIPLLIRKHILNERQIAEQAYVDEGWFRVVRCEWNLENGDMIRAFRTVVYQKGIDAIKELILEEAD
jgi:phage regulatory protein, rha family|nr:MAG TPA: antirepressor protein [Caudoviricetes sp.]